MYIERLLQINIGVMATLGTVLVGMGLQNLAVVWLMMAAAAASIWLTDITGRIRVPRAVTVTLAGIVMLLTLYEVEAIHDESILLAISNLLTTAQIMLLFQRKDQGVYWQLAILSLLQVMVATLFNQGLWFGVLLVIHMLVSLWTLVLLLFVGELRPYEGGRSPTRTKPTTFAGGSALAATVAGPVGRALGLELAGRLLRIGVATLVFCVVLFFAMPRWRQTAWSGPELLQTQLAGFNESVTLGSIGEILENRDEVLRVRFVRSGGKAAYPVREAVYLRGGILTRYEQGHWECPRWSISPGQPPRSILDYRPGELILQQITIEPLENSELFAVWPLALPLSDRDVAFERGRQRLLRLGRAASRRFSYEVGTTGFSGGRQSPWTPADDLSMTEHTVQSLLQLPDVPRLVRLGEEWVAESKRPASDRVGRARFLEAKFCNSSDFSYSLAGQERNFGMDPIEDFVSEHREGHCEYFATALALMLRSQSIPSRIVIGFHSDEWNDVAKCFEVRQLHAHSWVEAYFPASEVPADATSQGPAERWSSGGWLRLDPTPASATSQSLQNTALEEMGYGLAWLQAVWKNYVLEMDRERQWEEIYRPIVEEAKTVAQCLGDRQWWRAQWEQVGEILGVPPEHRWWLVTAYFVTLATVIATILGLLAWRISKRLFPREEPTQSRRRRGPAVEFYRRFERLLARRGLRRAAGQTHEEFARAASARIAEAGSPSLAALPLEITAAFYQARFGRLPLDSARRGRVEHALAELAAWRNGRPPKATL